MTSGVERVGPYTVESVWRTEALGRVVHAAGAPGQSLLIKQLCPPTSLAPADRERLLRAFEGETKALRFVEGPVALPVDAGADGETGFAAFAAPEMEGYGPIPPQLPPEAWITVGVQVCAALAALRDAGIFLHQVDPGSVFVSTGGAVRLYHLGWNHLPPRLQLPRGIAPPEPPYAAPEVLAGADPSPATLVFSVGAWLYGALAGPAAPSPAALAATGRGPDPLWQFNPAVPAPLDDAIRTALEPDPARRYRSLEQLAAALRAPAPRAVPEPLPAAAVEPTLQWSAAEPTILDDPAKPAPSLFDMDRRKLALWGTGLAAAAFGVGWWLGWIVAAMAPAPVVFQR